MYIASKLLGVWVENSVFGEQATRLQCYPNMLGSWRILLLKEFDRPHLIDGGALRCDECSQRLGENNEVNYRGNKTFQIG